MLLVQLKPNTRSTDLLRRRRIEQNLWLLDRSGERCGGVGNSSVYLFFHRETLIRFLLNPDETIVSASEVSPPFFGRLQ
jgi:hypothetical protein